MEKLNLEKLKNPQTFEKITQEVKECERFNFIGKDNLKAFQIFLSIDEVLEKHPEFQNENPELFKKYSDLRTYLKFHVLNFLHNDNDIFELYKKHFKDALAKNIDFESWLKLKTSLIGLPFRDDFLVKILASIKKNQQKIGLKNITISNKEVQPTIQNWIKDYEYIAEPGLHTLVERNNYFFHSKNIRNLNEDEKKQLKQLLQFYDKLHLKVTDIGGIGSYPVEMYNIDLKKPVAIEEYTTKEQQKINKSIQEPAGTIRPIPFPTKKTEEREKILAENKKEAEKAMQGAVDIEKLEAQEPTNKFIASLKRIGKPRKKEIEKESFKLEKKQPKIIKAIPAKEITKEIEKPKIELVPEKKLEPKIAPKPVEPEIPLKTFHKEKAQIITPAKPVSKELNKIQNITLADFKNLGQNAKQSAQALLTKIRNIAKTHDERAIARENFQKSPLYKLYQAMENQSASEKKSISQIASDRQKQNTEFLTEDEYIAVKSVSKLI